MKKEACFQAKTDEKLGGIIMRGWLRVHEAAEYCGVSTRTIRDWMKMQGLVYSRVRATILISVQNWISF